MGKKKNKKNKGGTGSEYFDYRYGVGEAKHLMDRYDVEGAASYAPDGRSMGKVGMRSDKDVKDDIAKKMMNDYDTRRTLEAAAMAGNKDAKKFAKKGIKGGNIQDAYGVMRDLKKEYVGGGGMSGEKNRAGLTYAMVKADRDNLMEEIDGRFEAMTPEEMEEDTGFTYEGPDKEISPEMQAAKDRVAAWDKTGGQGNPSPFGGGDTTQTDFAGDPRKSPFSDDARAVFGNADDQQAEATLVADSTDRDHAAQGFLAAHKEKMKRERNFTRDY